MTGTCSNNCPQPEVFPRTIDNRPGLSRIGFRIGTYADFRQALFSALDRTPLLLPWTHRQPEDPGIALLEGVAILGDILTFYQELYANEAFLRTATWPESITGLVRLLGYRPAPGIGGKAWAAFEFRGATASLVAAGFRFTAQLVGEKQPVDLETAADLAAVPQLSRFSLYAPWNTPAIDVGTNMLSVATSDLAAAGVTLKPKDRLALLDHATVTNAESVNWQIGVVGSVSVVLDQTVITLTGTWQQRAPSGGTLMAFKLGRSFHAFGYNAPTNQISITNNTASSTQVPTTIPLPQILDAFPLDRKVDDLSAGANMLVDLEITNQANQTEEFLLATTIYRAYLGSDTVGPMSGSVTKVELQTSHAHTGNVVNADRRTAQCLEVVGSSFQVSAARVPAKTGSGVDQLYFYGDGASYQQLNGRTLQFVIVNADDSVARLEQSIAATVPGETGDLTAVALRKVTLSPALQEFSWSDFALDAPTVTVLGNVVAVTQGKTQRQSTLGNGDARQVNQTFMVPKGPLTWLGDEALTPPRTPQLQVLVNDIEWTEVDSMFAATPTDTSYIIRQDESGNSWVQFGDGINGARLPSGVGNVLITYRTGVGANGDRTPGTNPQPAGQAQNLSAIRLYDTVTGGAAPESSDSARQTAPGRVQSLGRLVSLSDFEYEALALPGVEKAQANWDLSGGVPLLVLTVLLANPSDAALASVQASMSLANSARGPQRFQVQVQPASLQYVYLSLTFGLTHGYQKANVQAAIQTALGVIPDGGTAPAGGLFSVDQRQLGEPEYATRVEGVVQNVAGVDWVEVTAFGPSAPGIDPPPPGTQTTLPRVELVPCASNQVLALPGGQFNASPTTAQKGASA
jgi:hypothetical protein